MTQEQLATLRQKILDDVLPLTADGVGEPIDRFGILLRVIRAGSTNADVYEKAYIAAGSIDDANDKMQALMALLDEVDFGLQGDTQTDVPARLDSAQGEDPQTSPNPDPSV